MRKIIAVLACLLTLYSCDFTSQFELMVLEYAVHYPDTTVRKTYHFPGIPGKASAKVAVKTHWSSVHEELYLWHGTNPLVDEVVLSTTANIEIIGIYEGEAKKDFQKSIIEAVNENVKIEYLDGSHIK